MNDSILTNDLPALATPADIQSVRGVCNELLRDSSACNPALARQWKRFLNECNPRSVDARFILAQFAFYIASR